MHKLSRSYSGGPVILWSRITKFPFCFFLALALMSVSCKGDSGSKIESGLARHKDTVQNDGYYQEPYRPQFHFSPEDKWMNDPNGLVYNQGIYHLFYQYYPDDIVWGPMHWGHATSEDLIHWEHQPIALYPDDLGYIFSGSAVVDHKNSSGLGNGENDAVVAIYTCHVAIMV